MLEPLGIFLELIHVIQIYKRIAVLIISVHTLQLTFSFLVLNNYKIYEVL